MHKKHWERVLKDASARDTCWPGCANEWSPGNPAWGHCVMYALFMNERFGGDLIFVEAALPEGNTVPHYFNYVDGKDIDYSSSQFKKGTIFCNRKNITRAAILSLPDQEAIRYGIFRKRVLKLFG